jgi:ABC-type sugar transport system permease subunit
MAAIPQPSAGVTRHRASTLARRERNWGLIFLLPWIVGFLVFYAGPMIASLVFSFTRFDIANPEATRFVGLQNWQRLFSDPVVRQSLWVTARFMALAVPLQLGLALLFATLLNARHLFAKPLFRTLFFLPMMVPFVAATIIWLDVFNTQTGWINEMLGAIGIAGPDWKNDSRWVTPMLAIMATWGVGNAMLILLAGMQSVPTELYEAARVDGAGPTYSFFNITLPMISPVIFYNLVLAVVGAFQYFLVAYVIFNGTAGPGDSALFYMFNLYKEAFVYFNMGYASTLAWGMFFVALLVTIGLFGTARYWVYYAGSES